MKTYRPTTPSRRNTKTINYREYLTGHAPEKSLMNGAKRSMGRNNMGRITSAHRGGGNKRMYRDVDFLYTKKNIPAKIVSVEYDPNRSAFISLAVYADGEKRYIVTPRNIKAGAVFIVSETASLVSPNRLPLKMIPVGTFVYNVELKPNGGAKLARSAGNFIEVVAHDGGYAQLKMPSTEIRKVKDTCWATIGTVSNDEHKLVQYGKAGRSRWRGIRPKVRGSAMNPVDHPYGGGEGAQPRGTRRPKTRHGKITGGRKSRTPKKYSNPFIISRRRVGKNRKGN